MQKDLSAEADRERDRLRPGEASLDHPLPSDANLSFIGEITTPWHCRAECPRQGNIDGPDCVIEVFEPWQAALAGIEAFGSLEVLYWLDRSRRDLVLQKPAKSSTVVGTFALRSPARPNPIGTSIVKLVTRNGPRLVVRGLDCVTGTKLIDLKPDRCLFTPKAAEK